MSGKQGGDVTVLRFSELSEQKRNIGWLANGHDFNPKNCPLVSHKLLAQLLHQLSAVPDQISLNPTWLLRKKIIYFSCFSCYFMPAKTQKVLIYRVGCFLMPICSDVRVLYI